jgi:RNA polymerase sigma factor (TIGR02999 family)
MQNPGDFQETLSRAADGDDKAAAEVYPVIYDELRRIAGARMKHERQGHTLQPTALVNEAFMRVVGQEDADISSRTHFVAVASMAMQRILIDHARARGTRKRGGDRERRELHEDMPGQEEGGLEALSMLAEAVERLSEVDERKATVVRLRMLGGLSVKEVASVLNIARSTVDADWAAAKDWLEERLGLSAD